MKNNTYSTVIIFIIILILLLHNVYVTSDIIGTKNIEDKDVQSATKEFSNFSIIKPVIYPKRHKGGRIQKNFFHHPHHITVELPDTNKHLVLDLVLNSQLVSQRYLRQIQKNGTAEVQELIPEEVEICYYTGKVRNQPESWVALSTCNGLSGVIHDGHQMFYIEKMKFEKNNAHFLYSDKNFNEQKLDGSGEQMEQSYRRYSELVRNSRSVKISNSDSQSRYVELVLVVNKALYEEMNRSVKDVEDYCKNIVNIMNGLFYPLNIFIALVGVVVWTERDEILITDNGDETLTNFLQYRREKLLGTHPNDNAQLLTKSLFTNGVLGRALKKVICTFYYSGGIAVAHPSIAGMTAASVAHMLGHNLGMLHDESQCQCPDKACIMSPSQSLEFVPTHWSSCSRDALKDTFEHGGDHCLKNKPVSLFQGPICGNGFLEEGEECDCGLPEFCNSNCCDPKTCKLNRNATCATGDCCNLETCKFKRPGTVCRKTLNECDLPEYCTGDSEFCPQDVYKMDTEVCGNGFCYQGRCGTHLDQCSLLWGNTGKENRDYCYLLNKKGSRHGHCGYNHLTKAFEKCNDEDTLCGALHCNVNTSQISLQYGIESAAIVSRSFINREGAITPCIVATIDLGINDYLDPGMVPNGAKCGEDKMCLNKKCVPLTTLQEGRTCPYNCYNNGWCNNLRHCHCKPGYVLPFCRNLSPGGSLDSGPPDTKFSSFDTAIIL